MLNIVRIYIYTYTWVFVFILEYFWTTTFDNKLHIVRIAICCMPLARGWHCCWAESLSERLVPLGIMVAFLLLGHQGHRTGATLDQKYRVVVSYWYHGLGVLSSKTLSSNALSSKEHWSNETLVEWNIRRTEHLSNGTLVEWNIGRTEHWSNEHSSNGTFV